MEAMLQDIYGPPDVLHLGEAEKPDPAPNEVLVQVRAAGVDRGTVHLMRGEPYLLRVLGFGFRGPKHPVPGKDVAGTVVQVGSDVTEFDVGDEVFGIADGSFAEYAVARADKLVHKPAGLTFEQAAVVPISATTAMQGLRDVGRMEAGQRVLIIGASGGVGTYAVQIAKALGATVTGVCSTAKLDLVRSVGADEVIDYTHEDFADGPTRFDLILDIGGNSHISRLRRALAPKGTWSSSAAKAESGRESADSSAPSRSLPSCRSASPCSSTRSGTRTSTPCASSSRPVRSPRSSTARTRWPRHPTPCDTSKPDRHAARSRSRSDGPVPIRALDHVPSACPS